MFRSFGSSDGPPRVPPNHPAYTPIPNSQISTQTNSTPRGSLFSLSPRLKWALFLGVPIAVAGFGLAYYFVTRRSQTARTTTTPDGARTAKAKPSAAEPPLKKKEPETVLEKASAIKVQGNTFFKEHKYDKAIESYSAAAEKLLRRSQLLQAKIDNRPLPEPTPDDDAPPTSVEAARTELAKVTTELSTYYQNRAASYDSLGDLEAVVRDCTLALNHQKHYQKAITRRARAQERLAMQLVPRLDEGGCAKLPARTIREALVHLREAFEDLTATCILEAFSNADTLLACDRVLRLLALLRAQYIMTSEQEKGSAASVRVEEDPEFLISRQFSLPSASTIRSFFTPFERDPLVLQSRALPKATRERDSLTSSLNEAASATGSLSLPPDMITSFELIGGASDSASASVRSAKLSHQKYDRMLRAFADQAFEQAETLCGELLGAFASADLLQLDRDYAAFLREQRQPQPPPQPPSQPPAEAEAQPPPAPAAEDAPAPAPASVDEPQLLTVSDESDEKEKTKQPDVSAAAASASATASTTASPTDYAQLRSAQLVYACALSLRAAMRMLRNELSAAQADVQEALSRVARIECVCVEEGEKELWEKLRRDLRVSLLVKRAAIAVQRQDMSAAMKDFAEAIAIDPNNADVLHQRAQLRLIGGETEKCLDDFEAAHALRPESSIIRAQQLYAQYRLSSGSGGPGGEPQQPADAQRAERALKLLARHAREHKTCAESSTLYAQAMADAQRFDEADEAYKRAIELEPDNGNLYVHRALLILSRQAGGMMSGMAGVAGADAEDKAQAIRLIHSALAVDPKCEFGLETLGTLEVSEGNVDGALAHFKEAAGWSRSDVELSHVLSLEEAARAQLAVARKFSLSVPRSPADLAAFMSPQSPRG